MIPIWQRLLSIFIYMLPWSSAVLYGSDVFHTFPASKLFLIPTIPIFFIKESLPIGEFLIFLLLFIGVARNQRISYFIRFNTMQAILLNIILIIFNYFEFLLIKLSGKYGILENLDSIVFIGSLSIIIFATIQCLRGLEADIPGISNSAKIQIQ